jgi:hypothetical protein
MNKINWIVLVLILGFLIGGIPSKSHSENAEPVKKKGHMWLIPVLAGAGFAAGTFVGLSAFDDSINAEQKIWTTAALFSVGGGIAGWLIGRPKKEHVQTYGLPVHKFEIRRKEELSVVLLPNHSDLETILSDMQPAR